MSPNYEVFLKAKKAELAWAVAERKSDLLISILLNNIKSVEGKVNIKQNNNIQLTLF